MSLERGKVSIHSENIFPIIKKWLYSDKDIFVRELVSNACDAIAKYQRLSSMGEAESKDDFKVVVTVDRENRTISFTDNGIGMTEEEIKKYINQVAFSGAEDFVKKYQDKMDDANDIIGHFGLGFYSAFMVANKVQIDTLSYLTDAKPVRWASEDGMEFEISEGEKKERGTKITLTISEDSDEFLYTYKIREILNKYCYFLPVEIYLDDIAEINRKKKEDEERKEKGEEVEQLEVKPINNTKPLWLKSPKDCTDEEYKEFYKEVFHVYEEPLFWIHLNVDYPFNLKGILYFPKIKNEFELVEGEVKLYNNQVFVADNIKEVIPEFLLLLKGVIDCPDLPLNVSRSFLQNDKDVSKISKHIVKKVADKLKSLYKNDRENFEGFWNDIHMFIKYGCLKDESFYDKVKEVILYKDINSKYLTLDEYLKESEDTNKNTVYYVTDEQQQAQYIKQFKDNGLDAVIMNNALDTPFMGLIEYKEGNLENLGASQEEKKEQPLKFTRIDSDMSNIVNSDVGEEDKNLDDSIIRLFKDVLGEKLNDYKVESFKDENVTAMISVDEQSIRMSKMKDQFSAMGMEGMNFDEQHDLLINRKSPIVKKVLDINSNDENREKIELIVNQIADLAILSNKELTPDQLNEYVDRSNKLMSLLLDSYK
ncbi:molecular chaperone HtpG [Peptostreptococcus faecalis]|uniref:molecular chaperone HtpG n=1 Tax=Peptostreptococcus faecalis TaxID=2045015 RepID=UPI000C795879|nr:molecular chaperone HtpG [Peptostreptococcus faecalis]